MFGLRQQISRDPARVTVGRDDDDLCRPGYEVDPETQCTIALRGEARKLSRVMSNSFGFGGSNCVLVFGKGT